MINENVAVRKRINTRYLTMTAMLSAIATILMYLEVPIPIMPNFVKLDLSELPALIGAFAMGPVSGVAICLIKNLIHLLASNSAGVGELSNFVLGVCFVVPAGLIYKLNSTKRSALLGSIFGAVIMAAVSVPSNYYVMYPFYSNFMPIDQIIGAYQAILPSVNGLLSALLIFNLPFTFIKGMLSVLITFLIYKKISVIIKGNR